MSRNIVFEGWLTKSPPMKRIWRTKWRRRWFALRQGELPGQYFLDYYADRNCRRLKGTINLDLCEQVDAGLHMERSGHSILDPKLRGSVFTIQTQSRTYHLEADCEAEMERWVDAICRVCGLRSTEDSNIGACQNSFITRSTMTDTYSGPGPYIPISECITGVRDQGTQRTFTFDSKNIDVLGTGRSPKIYTSQPHIRHNNPEFSVNDSNFSDDECRSLNASQSNIQNLRPAAKSFTKLAISADQKINGVSDDAPPVPPPRPPKTFQGSIVYHGPKILEPTENQDAATLRPAEFTHRSATHPSPNQRTPRRYSQGAPPSPCRLQLNAATLQTTDIEDETLGHPSMQYCNLSSLPPAVDRALKPRHSSIGHIVQAQSHSPQYDEIKSDVLQYLDLDLKTSEPPSSKEVSRKNVPVIHGKSYSAADTDCAYKTVDFLKTEAFNSTRQDAEASRSKPLSVTIN